MGAHGNRAAAAAITCVILAIVVWRSENLLRASSVWEIAMLEERLANARVIEADEIKSDVVGIGSRVRLKDMDANETIEYTIVGSAEANPSENRLSNESPVGKAILGHKKGEIVEVAAPRGSLKFKIMDIKAA